MAIATPILTNFTGGELSPRLEGRTDVTKYRDGCRELTNMYVWPHGGATRRPGTYFVAEVKDSSKKVRLIPFQFNIEQAYILEFGDQYIRFYMDDGQIQSGGSPYEISSPYTEDELFDLQFAQSADVMYIVHPDHPPYKLSRTGHTSWTLEEVEFIDGPYLELNTTSTTITPSGTSGTITLTASDGIFQPGHVGSLWRIKVSSNWGYVKITGYTSSTEVTAEVKKELDGTTATTDWREGAWSDVRGYPRTVTFYENRLYFGGSSHQPQTVWGSKVDDYENFTPGTDDDDPVVYTIATDQVNVIQWMSPGDVLCIGTSGGEFTMKATTLNEPITPTNVQIKRETTFGSRHVMPVRIGHVVMFVQRDGRKIREFLYNFETDSYLALDATIWAEHITEGGIVQMAYQQSPDSTLWLVRGDGKLVGLTYEPAQKVAAWHKHETDGEFESVAVIPAPSGDYDEVWVAVKRTINGATKRYIEYFKKPDFGDDVTDAFYVDSGLTYDGSPTTTLSGLDHLEGKEVAILADGAVHPNRTVSSGQITLDWEASKVHVGLPYTSTLQTMRLEVGNVLFTSQGKIKRINKIVVRLYKSLGCKVGDGDKMDIIPFRSSADEMDQPPDLFTGDKVVQFPVHYSRDARITVKQEQPLPLTVVAIMPKIAVFDG